MRIRGAKKWFLFALVLVGCSDSVAPTPQYSSAAVTDLFLVAGQSNARGGECIRTIVNGVVSRECPYFAPYDSLVAQLGQLSMWPMFAVRYRKLAGRRVAIVNAHAGGSALHALSGHQFRFGNWSPTGAHFARSVEVLDSVLATGTYNLAGVLWVQGEQDALAIDSGTITRTDYRNDLIALRDRYRAHYGPTLPFYIFRTGSSLDGDTRGFASVRKAQMDVGNVVFLGAYTFPDRGLHSTRLHYSVAGYEEAGRIGARNLVALIP